MLLFASASVFLFAAAISPPAEAANDGPPPAALLVDSATTGSLSSKPDWAAELTAIESAFRRTLVGVRSVIPME